MKLTLSIGSSPDNEIRFQHPSISGHHALLHVDGGIVKIEDLNSANGTKVNGQVIHEAMITSDDQIMFGNYDLPANELFEKIKTHTTNQKVDYSEEYREVLNVFKEYRKKSIFISDPPKWPVMLRVGLTIGLISVLLLTNVIPRKYQYMISVLIGMTALIPSMFNNSGTKRRERLDALKIRYEDRLVCPKCKVSMINQSLAYWEGRKRCPNDKCDARFNE